MAKNEPNRTNEQAARWVVRMESGPLSDEEQCELDAWLDAAPHHRGALIRARAAWGDLDRLGAVAGSTANAPASERWSWWFRERSGRMVVAASALAAAAVFAYLLAPWLASHSRVIESDIGEIRRVTLDDGSGVVLNSGSRLLVDYSPGVRSVRLERGEAIFDVAKNKTRPFIVSTGGVSVRAVGTAFAVRLGHGDVAVTVTEGVVEVTPQTGPPQRVSVNERATARPRESVRVQVVEHAAAVRQLSWQNGTLSFAGEPLSVAVEEFNRYSRRRIVIDDPVLGRQPIVGIFRAGDVDAFAQAAATALNAEVHTADGDIHLIQAVHP
ncbi:MAG TPA: FecR domain-containing protein [Steroidobacteraceae bacterium]|nr:FecR domain-containing protein [Steroidobacteraceae bacterium]